jgi:predicted CoA-substrate-specific enzyme activase
MRAAGIDIGSRTVKVAVCEDGRFTHQRLAYTTHDPLAVCRTLLEGCDWDVLAATGYGRHLFQQYWDCRVVTEIRAAAAGICFCLPSVRAVLDIGGQDTKVVTLDEQGGIRKFEMNDRCAAGTGRFLEVMAAALGYRMEDFVAAGSEARREEAVSPMCTVFAESEVVSLVARGAERAALARGLHRTVARRAAALLRRLSPEGEVAFCGGAALNRCLQSLIEEELGCPVQVPAHPQLVVALGAAVLAG